jgi:D-alanine-D-alanine ligase
LVFKKNKAIRVPKGLRYPLFVKTLNEEASLGIAQGSVAEDEASLTARVRHIFEKYDTDVIAESYIEGREFYVSLMGNERLEVFPMVELEFGKVAEHGYPIASRKVKWDLAYRDKYGVKVKAPRDLPPALEARIYSVCKRAYRCLDLSGYARMDLRVTPEGKIYLIEANPNPDVGYEDEFHKSGELKGLSYEKILQRILRLGSAWSPRS